MKQDITIFVPAQSSRLKYIFDLIFREQLGFEYSMMTDVNQFLQCTGFKINCTNEKVDDSLFFGTHPILCETNVKPQKVDKVE